MGRRVRNRKELRAEYDAAERREEEERDEDEDEEEDEDDEEGDGDDDEEGDGDDDGDDDDGASGDDDDDEDAPKKKPKKKAAPKPKPKAKPRTRAVKVVRMKIVWGVFDNSSKRVAVYDYNKKMDAEAHAAKLTADKRNTHFIQPVKEPIEE